MCQLGAALVSENRVFRVDGVIHHTTLRKWAERVFRRERFEDAEFNFANREWDFDAKRRLKQRLFVMLVQTMRELWQDADGLVRFCETAGVPEDQLLTPVAARVLAERRQRQMLSLPAPDERYEFAKLMGLEGRRMYVPAGITDQRVLREIKDVQRAEGPRRMGQFLTWLPLFAIPENRIPVWREAGE